MLGRDAHQGLPAAGEARRLVDDGMEQRILGRGLLADVRLQVLEVLRRHVEQVFEARRVGRRRQQSLGVRERQRLQPRVAAFKGHARRARTGQLRGHSSASRMPRT